MDDEYRIEDLAADELAELLAEEGADLNDDQALALKQFIEQIGGFENALLAVEMLGQIEKAA